MSTKVMDLVWENYRHGGSHKLAMLALADWCNDEGGSLYPSIARVARKINVSESQTRRIIHGFIDEGYLKVIANHNGGNPGQSRHYKLNVEKLKTPRMDATPTMDAQDPLCGCARPLAPMTPKPSLSINNHQIKKEKELTVTPNGFTAFWDLYPNYPRKEGEGECKRLWIAKGLERESKEILEHLTFKTQLWAKSDYEYMPKPKNYLKNQDWKGDWRKINTPSSIFDWTEK